MIQFLICWQIFLWGRDCTEWGRRWGCGWKPHVREHITGQSPLRTGQQTHVQLPEDRYTSASDAWENESLQCNWLTCPLFDLKNENKKKITVQCSKKPSPIHLSSLFLDPPGLEVNFNFLQLPSLFKKLF